MKAIEFDSVDFSYQSAENETPVEVLKDFSFSVEKGSFVALLGRNGSGKSTIAKLINGLLTASKGKITVCGIELSDKTVYEVRKKVGMVFQNPDNQQVASIVEDDVAFGPENIGVEREEIGRRIDYALKSANIENLRNSQVARLSGGQKQRVAIAGALALMPEILILDESTSMLDPKGRREIADVIRTLNKEKNITVISVTHYMDEAAEADEIFVLDKGKITLKGTPSEVFSNEDAIISAGLSLPRATIIAKKLKERGVPLPDGILTKEALGDALCKSLRKI